MALDVLEFKNRFLNSLSNIEPESAHLWRLSAPSYAANVTITAATLAWWQSQWCLAVLWWLRFLNPKSYWLLPPSISHSVAMATIQTGQSPVSRRHHAAVAGPYCRPTSLISLFPSTSLCLSWCWVAVGFKLQLSRAPGWRYPPALRRLPAPRSPPDAGLWGWGPKSASSLVQSRTSYSKPNR